MPLAFSEFRFAIPGCQVVSIRADTDYWGDFTITASVVQETIVIWRCTLLTFVRVGCSVVRCSSTSTDDVGD